MRPLTATTLSFVALLSAGSEAEGASVAIPRHDYVRDMRVSADGVVHVALQPMEPPVTRTTLVDLDASGALLPASKVVFPQGFDGFYSALTPDGGLVAADWHAAHHTGQTRLVEVGHDGSASRPTVIPGLGHSALVDKVVVGPTGTVAVYSEETANRGSNPMIVVRPAGSAVFSPAVRLGPRQTEHQRERTTGAAAAIALGPDGGGAVIFQSYRSPEPLPVLRRINPDGSLGPPISVPIGRFLTEFPSLKIGATGTILAGFDVATSGSGVSLGLPSHVAIATLPVGASAVTPVQDLGPNPATDGGLDLVDSNIDFAIGPDDQAAVIAGSDPHGLRIFAGPATALQPLPLVPADGPVYSSLAFSDDGSLTVLWGVYAPKGVTGTITAAHRLPAQNFGPPTVVASAKNAGSVVTPDKLISLPGGQLELNFSDLASISTSGDYLTRLQP